MPRHAASVSQLGAIQSEAGKMLARRGRGRAEGGKEGQSRTEGRPRFLSTSARASTDWLATAANINRLSIWRGISNKKQRGGEGGSESVGRIQRAGELRRGGEGKEDLFVLARSLFPRPFLRSRSIVRSFVRSFEVVLSCQRQIG